MTGREENRSLYLDDRVVGSYAQQAQLLEPEALILARVEPEVRARSILDVGVGGGRTTPHLRRISSDYIGIDYSSKMVAACRMRFPGVRFEVCDARDLGCFHDSRFDFVFFSFNGIDSVGHEDRLRILRELHRVLRPGGLFVFSSHNRSSHVVRPTELSNLRLSANPLASVKHVLQYLNGIRNYLRSRRREVHAAEYSILADRAHNYRVLHYYIDKSQQLRQLESAGFSGVEIFDLHGAPTDVVADDRESRWLHYLARRQPPPVRSFHGKAINGGGLL